MRVCPNQMVVVVGRGAIVGTPLETKFQKQYNRNTSQGMSKFSYIAAQFGKLGYSDSAKLKQYELNVALDKIIQSNMVGMLQFEREIAEELFQQTKKDPEGYVLLRDYIDVILQAHAILQKHIASHQQELANQTDHDKKEDIKAAIFQFQQELRLLTEPFHLHSALPSHSSSEKRIATVGPTAQSSQAGPVAEVGLEKSSILPTESSEDLQSGSLVWVLAVAAITFPFELLEAFVKSGFLNVLAVVMVLTIFVLNYFDKQYVRTCIVGLVVSVLLDFFWLISFCGSYWNPTAPSHRSTHRVGYLRFTVLMTVTLMLLLGALLYPYKNNKPQTRKTVKLGSLQFELSGNGANNPLSIAFPSRIPQMGAVIAQY